MDGIEQTNNQAMITINDQAVPWGQVFGYMQLFGKLQPFLQEFVSQYILVQEINRRDDLPIDSSELMQAIMDFRIKEKLTEPEIFEEWLKKENLDNRTFQTRVGFGLKLEKLKQVIAAPNLESYFQANQDSLEELLLHCVITPEKELSEKLKQRLTEENISIEDLAKEYVDSEQKIRFFKQKLQRRSLSKFVREELASASEGDLIGPVEMEKNWSVFRVKEIIPSQLDEKVKKQIEAELFGQWLIDKLRQQKIGFTPITDLPAGI